MSSYDVTLHTIRYAREWSATEPKRGPRLVPDRKRRRAQAATSGSYRYFIGRLMPTLTAGGRTLQSMLVVRIHYRYY